MEQEDIYYFFKCEKSSECFKQCEKRSSKNRANTLRRTWGYARCLSGTRRVWAGGTGGEMGVGGWMEQVEEGL